MIFRILTIFVLVTAFIWLYKIMKNNDLSIKDLLNNFWDLLKDSWNQLFKLRSYNITQNLQAIKSFVLLFTVLEFIIMAVTGFLPILITGEHLTGILLLIHVAVAPVIALSFAVLVVLFAHSNRFNDGDIYSTPKDEKGKIGFRETAYLKIIFWLISLVSIPAMVSIILGMFPIFGTDGQNTLLEIHRYSVLIIGILVILYVGLNSNSSKQKLNSIT